MTIIDSHWAKTENSAWNAYVAQHIPGAMFCDPLTHLASEPSREKGRNPLPDVKDLQRALDDWGVTEDRPVYIYDAGTNLYAARAWWVLRWAGLDHVYILNGGTPQWEKAGGDVAGGVGALRGRGNCTVLAGSMPQASIEDVDQLSTSNSSEENAGGGQSKILIDAREPDRFSGRKEPYDHQAGHIPGARNLPVTSLLTDQGTMPAPADLRSTLAELGIERGEDVVVYSGSGLHSSLFIAALEHAGLPGASNFVGGWSQWAASFTRKIERE